MNEQRPPRMPFDEFRELSAAMRQFGRDVAEALGLYRLLHWLADMLNKSKDINHD